mmetsp:Transcript_22032/g.37465  ORF Transcript_22032/g.37465 Transcript_22032/m.37465 type:complete len:85 (-) Transcript_22032:145-399(-)
MNSTYGKPRQEDLRFFWFVPFVSHLIYTQILYARTVPHLLLLYFLDARAHERERERERAPGFPQEFFSQHDASDKYDKMAENRQ